MESRHGSYFGQGPKMVRPAILVALLGGIAAWLEPDVFRLAPGFMQPLRMLLGWMLTIGGVVFYFWGLFKMVPAVKSGRLETGGPFAMVRHPMYSAVLVFLFPGIALLTGAWFILVASIVGWLAFRKWAPVEEQSMLESFGQEYADYKAKTRALFPFPE